MDLLLVAWGTYRQLLARTRARSAAKNVWVRNQLADIKKCLGQDSQLEMGKIKGLSEREFH